MNNPAPVHYAGFWRRFAALVLDVVLLFTLTAPFLYLGYGHEYFRWLVNQDTFLQSYGVLDFILTRLLPFSLVIYFWHHTGATPGKLLLECKIVDATSLQTISWKQALIRLPAYLVSMLPAYLGFLWMIWDKRKQTLHDKLSNTVVLNISDDIENIPLSDWIKKFK